MNLKLKAVAAIMLAACFVAASADAADAIPPVEKKHSARKHAKKEAKPSVEDQVQKLREELQAEINGLKSDIAAKDAALMKAQQDAAAAQAEATRAQTAASAQQSAVTENAAAVSTLNATVNDLKANETSLATSISDETSKIKKMVENPTTLHYKGITLTPGGYLAGETVYRTHATGGDIPTAFSALPYEKSGNYTLSEFYGTGRHSRITLMAEGKTNWGTLRGYYEADFLGTGTSSNNNQSNSYVLRERALYAQVEWNSHLSFSAGQMWSLATEDKKGITSATGDIMTPQTIDPNYVTGFVWTRQYGARLVKNFKHVGFGIAAENAQVLYTASLAGNTPYALLGSAGQNGGNYNAAISSSVPTLYIQNYTNPAGPSTGGAASSATPVTALISANTNIANYSFNQAPDVIIKASIDPGWGHWEILGIARFAHETVYPGVTTNSVKYGNQKDIEGFNGGTPNAVVVASSNAIGSYQNSIVLGGVGGSMRVPLLPKDKLTFGAKALYGSGVGRYGNSTLADVTSDANGNFAPIHGFSGLATLEAKPTSRLLIYLNYGGDYAGRADFGVSGVTTTLGSPTAVFCPTGTSGISCVKSPTSAQLLAGGTWGGTWNNVTTGLTNASDSAVGYGSRLLNNSACLTSSNPGYNGGSTGYYPGGSCGAQTRDVQEITGGYWYDFYKGDRGRFRQSIQYAYAVREGWSGAPPAGSPAGTPRIGAKGVNNMFWTSFRYYLP